MHLVDRTLRWQRRILAAVCVGSALAFWRGGYDVFNTFKATLVAVGALGLVLVAAVRVSRTRRPLVPDGRWWLPVAAFAGALAVVTVAAMNPMVSVVGRPGRHTGLGMYLVYLLVFLVAVRLYRRHPPSGLAKALVVAAVPVTGYGLLQAAGGEPLGWDTIEGGPQVFATFGNANFFSAWLGVVTPLAVYGALTQRWAPPWRAGAGLLALLAVAAQFASQSLQGPLAAAVGAALVVAVWLFSAGGAVSRRRVPILAGAVVAGVGVAALPLAGVGPLAAVRDQAARSLLTRTGHWETALAMGADRPVLGFGLGSFGDWAFHFRPEWFAVERGLTRSSDSAHSVPLEMFANGGVVLAACYLAFVALAAWALVTGLRRLEGEERLLLGGFGGAWLAYQTQSLLSIDVPPLAVLHFVLAGVVVAVGLAPGWRELTLPGAPALPAHRPGRKRKKAAVPLAPASPALLAAIVVAALPGLWAVTTPLRADLAAQVAREAAAAGDTRTADASYQRAASVAFWESRYPVLRGEVLAGIRQYERARDAYLEAAEREPRGLATAMNLARMHVRLNEPERADEWYDTALALDPKTPETLAEAGQWYLTREASADAEHLLARAVALRGDEPDWWVALGRARTAEGDRDGARAAFRRALELDPAAEGAEEGLEQVAVRQEDPDSIAPATM